MIGKLTRTLDSLSCDTLERSRLQIVSQYQGSQTRHLPTWLCVAEEEGTELCTETGAVWQGVTARIEVGK